MRDLSTISEKPSFIKQYKNYKSLGCPIFIDSLDIHSSLYQMKFFTVLLHLFNKENRKNSNKNNKKIRNYTFENITTNLYLLQQFEDFILQLAFTGKIPFIIAKKDGDLIQNLIRKFKDNCLYDVRAVDAYYAKIRNKLYDKEKILNNKEDIDKEMRLFNLAYHLVKSVFEERKRDAKNDSGESERAFNHLKGVLDILLDEFDNTNLDQLIIGLLHDSIEDIEGINFEFIKTLFGKYIATGVEELSKKDVKNYMNFVQKFVIKTLNKDAPLNKKIYKKAKFRKIIDYFGDHMKDLKINYLNVKFADRIHNLRTLYGIEDEKKIVTKVIETEIFFIELASKKNEIAWNLMRLEIIKLRDQYKSAFIQYEKEITREFINEIRLSNRKKQFISKVKKTVLKLIKQNKN